MQDLVKKINSSDRAERLQALRTLAGKIKSGEIERVHVIDNVNNHIHTKYSFSPYYPSMALYKAYEAGLKTAGIMDHDSVGGDAEFIEAGKILDIPITIGFECRVNCDELPIKGRRINNPDQNGVAYVAMHGIPFTQIETVEKFLAPFREKRNERNAKMVNVLNGMMSPYGISFNFESDVCSISEIKDGGSITERHVLYALALKVIEKYGRGRALVDFLKNDLKMNVSGKMEEFLLDENNEIYVYDLLGAMKSSLVEKFYIDADEECPKISEFIEFTNKVGGISAYAYLGDVGNSVTGDKKAQKFEDDYIDMLFESLKQIGFNAVTYMPTRNTLEQLQRVRDLCKKYNLFEISGEDINSPRQKFVCEALNRPEFSHLITATWALIGHQQQTLIDVSKGMFSKETIAKYPDLEERINVFANFVKKS